MLWRTSPGRGGAVETNRVTLGVEVVDEGGGIRGPWLVLAAVVAGLAAADKLNRTFAYQRARELLETAIDMVGDVASVNREKCDGCGLCVGLCPVDAITLVSR